MAAAVPQELTKRQHRLDLDRDKLAELETVTATDFPHATRLQDLSTELHHLRRELREAETSPEAIARNDARLARLRAKGREQGWSLMLNATPALVEELGCSDADEVRQLMADREHEAATEHEATREQAAHGGSQQRSGIATLIDDARPMHDQDAGDDVEQTDWQHNPDTWGSSESDFDRGPDYW